MTNFLVSLTLLATVLIRWSATEGDNADLESFLIENQSEIDEEQLLNDKWKKAELDDNDDALLEYFDSLRRQNKRQDIISDPADLSTDNDEWRREKRLHCCRKYCRCCPYKCRWICPLC